MSKKTEPSAPTWILLETWETYFKKVGGIEKAAARLNVASSLMNDWVTGKRHMDARSNLFMAQELAYVVWSDFYVPQPSIDWLYVPPITLNSLKAIKVYFSPGNNLVVGIVEVLNEAKESILIQAYAFTSASIADAIKKAF
ncbi:MAG: hypothetical protein LBB40_02830 [Holophagales bacterium]|jgi:DNA-binding transcriptional regulator YdaS (Cro superfamily)|nr:hypothetical protein [Holophagales bacterium]